MSNKPIKAWYSSGGSLMTSEPIEDVTQELREASSRAWYGGRWFVCETVMRPTAKILAEAMGWEWCEHGPCNEETTTLGNQKGESE